MCTYCGCRSIEVIGRYSDEHEAIVNLLGDVRRSLVPADDSGHRALAASNALATALGEHTASEERSLFAELRLDPDFTEHVDSLCAEHRSLDEALEIIHAGGAAAHAAYPAFELALRAHIDREENGLFPAAAIALDGPSWERIHERA